MSDSVLGLLFLVGSGLLVVTVVLSFRRRPAAAVVTPGSARGQAGTAIHPWRGHWSAQVASGLFAVGVVGLGVWYLARSQGYAGVVVIGAGLLLGYLLWARWTGRAGDGTLTLTPEGVHQRYRGSEAFVPWDVVRGLVTSPQEFILETTGPVIPVRRMPPLFGRTRTVLQDDAIGLPTAGLPPLPYAAMVELYSETPSARAELATDALVLRAREFLEEEQWREWLT